MLSEALSTPKEERAVDGSWHTRGVTCTSSLAAGEEVLPSLSDSYYLM